MSAAHNAHTAWRLGTRRAALSAAAFCAAMLAPACADQGPATAPTPDGASLNVSATQPPDAQRLARGIALAVAKPQVRAHLRNALRDSRFTDHKLVLQDYVQQREGRGLVAEAASALGTTTEALLATITALPRLDFYVPFREHRLAWRGSPDVQVAAVFDGDAPEIQAFGADGGSRTLRLADGVPGRALIILHPEEPKGVRPASELTGSGDVIQRAEESRVLGNVREPGGSLRGALAPSLYMEDGCGEEAFQCDGGGGGGGGSYAPAPGVYITEFDSHRGDGWWGSLEMEWRSSGVEGTIQLNRDPYTGNWFWLIPVKCDKGKAVRTIEGHGYTGQLMMLSPGVTNVNGLGCGGFDSRKGYQVEIYEMDGGLNGNNDHFGRRFFGYPATGLPFGALIGVRENYYNDPLGDFLSMTVKLEYRF